MIILIFHEKIIISNLLLWVNYYVKNNIPFLIYSENSIENVDLEYITQDKFILEDKENIILKECDFLFSYSKSDTDEIILSSDLTNMENEKSIIKKLFYVPILNKKEYTTFEVPDFILSENEIVEKVEKEEEGRKFVCLTLETNCDLLHTKQYFETNILFEKPLCLNEDNKKYKYAVYCQMKDEDLLINTWIEHYISLGFEHLYIIDDNSTNKISDFLIGHPYINNITIFTVDFTTDDFNNENIEQSFLYEESLFNNKQVDNRQTYILNSICKIITKDVDWLFICDADEFLYLKDYKNIQEYMNYSLVKHPNMSGIHFQWVFYGTSYHSYFPEKGHLFDKFIYSDETLDIYGKSIIKTKDCTFYNIHSCNLISDKLYGVPFLNNIFYIKNKDECNNYYGKFLENKFLLQPYTSVNAFCAHFVTLDCNTFYKRRFIRKSCTTSKIRDIYFAERIKSYNNVYNTSLIKNSNNISNIECNKLVNFKKYNSMNNTNFNNTFNLLQHFYENKTEIIYSDINYCLPEDYDVSVYKELNSDLSHLSDLEAKKHYLNSGILEKRKYKIDFKILPDGFDVTLYKLLNGDLSHFSDLEAKIHYITNGINEKRIYKVDDEGEDESENILNLPNPVDTLSIHEEYQSDLSRSIDFQEKKLKYPYLFHKYILDIKNPNKEIDYVIFKKNKDENEFVCNLHIFDISTFDSFYGKYISNLLLEFNITITFIFGDIPKHVLNYNVNIIKIQNRGYDIGGKICFLKFLLDDNRPYKYILFLHSKTNIEKRNSYFEPLIKNLNRIKLIKNLLKYKNIYSIFPDIIWYDHKNNKNFNNYDLYISNMNYYNEITEYLNMSNTDKIFPEGNCFICNRIIIDFLFNKDYKLFYNMLNHDNSFDFNWFQIYNNNKNENLNKCYELFINHNMFGNNILISTLKTSLPDGMIEHVFERLWINIIKHLKGDYLILNEKNLIDEYNIKLNAMYFPQFHEIPENNEFWGDKFTEWTLLKPYDINVIIEKTNYPILKPHEDIGYYDLNDNGITINKQIEIAKKYNINGFIIYHYWFDDNKKVMYKPLEYFLNDTIDFPFCISWANETWSKRWDGTKNEVLIEQNYNDWEESYLLHIHYLIPFFKKKNYIKNREGECILYIYNFNELLPTYNNMIKVWNEELKKHDLTIDIIITENNCKKNHNINDFNLKKFVFEPMYSTIYNNLNKTNIKNLINKKIITKETFDIKYYFENNKDLTKYDEIYLYNHFINYGYKENRKVRLLNNVLINHNMSINYDYLINNYQLNKYDTKKKHLGLALYWNNIVRRKNLPYLYVKNYSESKMEELLLLLLTDIVYKYKNIYDFNIVKIRKYDNIININAWNEWNEQAVLEPNNITGYSTLESIYKIISDL